MDLSTMLFIMEMSYSFSLKCNFINAHKKNTAFPVKIIMELANTETALR